MAVVLEALTLRLIDAGPLIHYQHYRSLADVHPIEVFLLFAAMGAVAIGLWRRRSGLRAVSTAHWGWAIRWLPGLLLFILSSAALSRSPAGYVTELVFATVLQAANLGAAVLFAATLPDSVVTRIEWGVARLDLAVGRASRLRSSTHLLLGAASVWVCVTAAGLAYFVYEGIAHSPDEVLYLYQARTLASGATTTPAPPVPEAFTIYMIPTHEPYWYSPFPPGWPAVLAIGVLAGMPWLVNPILAGMSVVLTYLVVRMLYGRKLAFLVTLLVCVSPWNIFMAMSLMSHTLTLTLALAAVLAILCASRSAPVRWALVAGACTGLVSLVRPLDGVVVAICVGLSSLAIARRRGPWMLAGFGIGTMAFAALVLPYNARITGNPFLMPMDAYFNTYFWPGVNALGFGPHRGFDWELDAFPGHSPIEAALNAALNIFSINVELFGWGIGSFIPIIVLVSSNHMRRMDWLMLTVAVLVVGLYSLYWYSGGPDFGARYWFLLVIPLVVLSARGIELLREWARTAATRGESGDGRVVAALGLLIALTILLYFPWRAVDKYRGYLGMRSSIAQLAEQYQFGKSLVIVRGDEHPDYQAAWATNPLSAAEDAPLYARFLSVESVERLRMAFPDRPIWIVDGPSTTRDTYRVRGGPFSPDAQVPIR